MPSDPHIPLMCGLYQAFHGSHLPIASDSPCLCLRRYLIRKTMPVLTRQLRLAVRMNGKAYAAMCQGNTASSSMCRCR